jgi:hypothetical protein
MNDLHPTQGEGGSVSNGAMRLIDSFGQRKYNQIDRETRESRIPSPYFP